MTCHGLNIFTQGKLRKDKFKIRHGRCIQIRVYEEGGLKWVADLSGRHWRPPGCYATTFAMTNSNTRRGTRNWVELASPLSWKVATTSQLMEKKDNYAVKIQLMQWIIQLMHCNETTNAVKKKTNCSSSTTSKTNFGWTDS